jgi:hypothetical protein
MANLIIDSALDRARNERQFNNPIDRTLDLLPRKWCKTCERYLEDHTEIDTDKYAGMWDTEHGQVPNLDRLLEMREVPFPDGRPGTGWWEHRYSIPGGMLHKEAVAKGY